MKFRIHFTDNEGSEDSYILTGNTIDNIRSQNEKEMKKRNINIEDNNVWSENLAPAPEERTYHCDRY